MTNTFQLWENLDLHKICHYIICLASIYNFTDEHDLKSVLLKTALFTSSILFLFGFEFS